MKIYPELTVKRPYTVISLSPRLVLPVLLSVFMLLSGTQVLAQLGVYEFSGKKSCPTQNPDVTAQPEHASFSVFSTVNATCKDDQDGVCTYERWNKNSTIDLNEYHQFSINADANYVLNLKSFSFTQYIKNEDAGDTRWILRSSVDNFTTDLGSGLALENSQTTNINLPAEFSAIASVTFRIYLVNSKDDGNRWSVDNVSVDGSVEPFSIDAPPAPVYDGPKCAGQSVTLSFDGTPPAGETWFWQTSATGTSTANSGSTYIVSTPGTYYLRARNNSTLAWSDASSVTIDVLPNVSTPVFDAGNSSYRCLGASSFTYTATAENATSITYSLDLLSIAAGNTIDPTTGQVNFPALWVGATTITATAQGCGGPKIATHTVTANSVVGTPLFVSGPASSRCQGAGNVTYAANAANASSITYSLDAASLAAGNTINPSNGTVTYVAGWSGTSVITASAQGCGGPKTAAHTVTVNAPVQAPVFAPGNASTRCQGSGLVTYTATAANSSAITYSLNAEALAGGNSINASTGIVSYAPGWTGTTIITATATGCSGPATSSHTVTITPSVQTPVFAAGNASVRCQSAQTTTYNATANHATGIEYSLDAASLAAGNTIASTTGAVTFVGTWSGVSTITAKANGCNGPAVSTHTVTTTATVGAPVFDMGIVSTRAQGSESVIYHSVATNTTGITYSLDAASLAAGNTINATTGEVNYSASWSGTTIITASAAGCGGPVSATHTVTVNNNSVIKQLYLSDPAQSLDRVDPVNTNDNTTASTTILSTAGTTNTSFTMNPVLCDSLTIKTGNIRVVTYVTISSGTMPANPNITAALMYGANNIITLTQPVYNSVNNTLTWNGSLASDMIIPAGSAISLRVTTAQAGVNFRIDFDSQTKPSRIELPVSTYINIVSLNVYNAPYPGGIIVHTGLGGAAKYIRATVTDPFGSGDITGLGIKITPAGNTFQATSVGTSGCTRTYEYVWNVPGAQTTYAIAATAREGYENTVTHKRDISFSVCNQCAPTAMNDSISGAGGNPVVVDVLSNDYDPNNNLNPASLTIVGEPANGSAYVANNTIVYLPNGAFQGVDTVTYQICDLSSPTPLCSTAQVFFTIDPLIIDICGDATKTHTYFIPYPEDQAYMALEASGSPSMPSNNIRTIISIKVPYPGMTIVWDEWEDGYEANTLNPVQSTTKVWGDGNPFNGIAPGYSDDIIPAGASIVLDNTMNANPRNPSNIYFDGKDKVVTSGQVAITQVSAEPSIMSVQSIKTNVTSTYDYGQSFTIPLGEDFPSRDFRYTALFIRAAENNTVINIDKDNNGTFETTQTLNQGQSYLVNGGVLTGATVASNKPVGVELNAGGVDNYSIRNAPVFPATWYSNTYYTPVPTSDNAGDNPKDTSVVMFYNSLNRPININWYSGQPANGVINVPAKSAVRFPLAYSTTAAYKFVNHGGESFTAIEIVNSYAPGGGGSSGSSYDWSFNLISEARLTDYTTVAWAPGGLDLDGTPGPDVNGNPIWVTPTANTTIYIKYDGNINGSSGSVSPCGLRYDEAINVNALNYIKIRDNSDNDQGGIAIYTCNGAKIAAAYGEDPRGSTAGNSAYWDVGTTIQPFCKQKLVIANDDHATSLVNQPVTIPVLNNDFGFLSEIDPTSISTVGLLQPRNGTVSVNANGTILYIPNNGFAGVDTFEYRVCSTPSPVVCDVAMVVVTISTCPSNGNQNIISGQVFLDRNKDGANNDGGAGLAGVKVYLYTDGNCNGTVNANELTDSVTVDNSGFYQFARYPEKLIADNFDNPSGGGTCANGSDGDTQWANNWTDNNDGSSGFCQGSSTADAEIVQDGAFGYAMRLKDNDVSVQRRANLSGATKAFFSFSYRRATSSFSSGENVYIQVSSNGTSFTTIYTVSGNGNTDASPVMVYNLDISSFASANTTVRFLTNGSTDNDDIVFIDNVAIRFLKYPQCYITRIDPASVPANYSLTTAGQKAVSFTNGGSCTSQFDYGFGKPNVTVSGTLRLDANGLKDGLVNGSALGKPDAKTVYAYLADVSGKIAFKTTVNSGGAYNFTLAEVHTEYILALSTQNLALGSQLPEGMDCPGQWVNVGDSYGINNLAGSGAEPGTPDARVSVKTGSANVTNVDFGIQRRPTSDNFLRSITQPKVNDLITLDGAGVNPPVVTGSDPEDCLAGCILTSRTIIIDTVPSNSEMYYNNTLVTNGQVIENFNPNLLQILVTPAALGDVSIEFSYSFVDAAGVRDPSPAKYTMVWLVPLPATGLTLAATLDGKETLLQWHTLSEQNTSHFVIERSADNSNFNPIGYQVQAAGNSVTRTDYRQSDNIEGLTNHPVIYYRVKLVDINGKISYSNVSAVRMSAKPGVAVWPNPFQSAITVSITTTRESTIDVRLIDVNGRVLKSHKQDVGKGTTQVAIQDLSRLPAGVYLVEITDKSAGTTFQKLIKNH